MFIYEVECASGQWGEQSQGKEHQLCQTWWAWERLKRCLQQAAARKVTWNRAQDCKEKQEGKSHGIRLQRERERERERDADKISIWEDGRGRESNLWWGREEDDVLPMMPFVEIVLVTTHSPLVNLLWACCGSLACDTSCMKISMKYADDNAAELCISAQDLFGSISWYLSQPLPLTCQTEVVSSNDCKGHSNSRGPHLLAIATATAAGLWPRVMTPSLPCCLFRNGVGGGFLCPFFNVLQLLVSRMGSATLFWGAQLRDWGKNMPLGGGSNFWFLEPILCRNLLAASQGNFDLHMFIFPTGDWLHLALGEGSPTTCTGTSWGSLGQLHMITQHPPSHPHRHTLHKHTLTQSEKTLHQKTIIWGKDVPTKIPKDPQANSTGNTVCKLEGGIIIQQDCKWHAQLHDDNYYSNMATWALRWTLCSSSISIHQVYSWRGAPMCGGFLEQAAPQERHGTEEKVEKDVHSFGITWGWCCHKPDKGEVLQISGLPQLDFSTFLCAHNTLSILHLDGLHSHRKVHWLLQDMELVLGKAGEEFPNIVGRGFPLPRFGREWGPQVWTTSGRRVFLCFVQLQSRSRVHEQTLWCQSFWVCPALLLMWCEQFWGQPRWISLDWCQLSTTMGWHLLDWWGLGEVMKVLGFWDLTGWD